MIIETKGLIRRFGTVAVVNNLNLAVPGRSVYGLLGTGRAGKTTVIRMLLGNEKPDEGIIKLFGEETDTGRMTLDARIGALVNAPAIYVDLTGRANLELHGHLAGVQGEDFDFALDATGLTDTADLPVREYSPGMRRRLDIATALLGRPELLILDEPAVGLDDGATDELHGVVRRLAADRGITVLFTSHLLAEVERVATHAGIIDQGALIFQGTIEQLRAQYRRRLVVGVDTPEWARQLLEHNGWSILGGQNGNLELDVVDREQAATVNALLVAGGVKVSMLRMREPTLENAFLQRDDHRPARAAPESRHCRDVDLNRIHQPPT